MLLGIGIDILSLSRLEALTLRRGSQTLAKRLCCRREYDEFMNATPTTSHNRFLSSRYAALSIRISESTSEVEVKINRADGCESF